MKPILILLGLAAAAYGIWYYTVGNPPTYPYTVNGVTYNADGSYSFVDANGTVHNVTATGQVTVTYLPTTSNYTPTIHLGKAPLATTSGTGLTINPNL